MEGAQLPGCHNKAPPRTTLKGMVSTGPHSFLPKDMVPTETHSFLPEILRSLPVPLLAAADKTRILYVLNLVTSQSRVKRDKKSFS